MTAQKCLSLLGHMASCTYVMQHVRLRLRPLQAWLALVYSLSRHHLDSVLTVPASSCDWTMVTGQPHGMREGTFSRPHPSLSLECDTSALCWAAHLTPIRTQSLWAQEELSPQINVREFRAVCLACQAFLPNLTGKSLSVLTDNTMAMIYINRQGDARSSPLYQEAFCLWVLCIDHDITLEASYLPGTQNQLADHLS